jgi:hypothetical protein
MPGIGKTYETDPNAYAGIGRKIIEAVRGAVTAPGGEAGILTEAGRTLDYPLSERGRGIVTTIPTPPVVSPANPVIAPTINPSAIPTKETPHPAAGTKDLWDFASRLSPERLKAFVDKNQNNPNLVGVGYVETKDPKTGKARIEPVISRPEPQGLNTEQFTALGHYNYGIGQQAIAREAAETRKADLEARAESRIENLDLKNKTAFEKELDRHSPLNIVTQQKDQNVGLFDMALNNLPIHKEYLPQAKRMIDAFNTDYYPAFLKANKFTDTPANRIDAIQKYKKYLSPASTSLLTK